MSVESLEGRQLLAITVSTFSDVVDLGDGLTSLREAIDLAASSPGADTIIVPHEINGVTGIYAVQLGELGIDDADGVTIQSQGGPATIDAQGLSRVFSVASGSVVGMEGLVITGGHAADFGGGLLNRGSVTITESTFEGNSADVGGGGIFTFEFSSTVIIGSTLSGNTAGDFGGGISNAGHLEITDSTISGNSAFGSNGGGLDTIGDVLITGSLFQGNYAAGFGGGFANHGILGTHGTMVVGTTRILGNTAGANGGGFDSNGVLSLSDSLIDGNYAGGFGGGIGNGGTLTDSNSTISNNSASGNAGGIFNYFTDDTFASKMDLVGTTIQGNTSLFGFGGGISTWGTATITGGTIDHNYAYYGGGAIDNYVGSLAISGTPIHDNTAGTNGGAIHNYTATLSIANSPLNDNSASNYGGGLYTYFGTVAIADSVLSGNSAYYGGGLYNDYGSTTTITDTTFQGNTASYGGGLYNGYFATLSIADSTVEGHTVSYGGGLYNDYGSTTTITDTTFQGNTAYYGGGLYNNYATLSIADTAVGGNTAYYGGGGIYNSSGTVNITGGSFDGNAATYGSGGGVYTSYGSTVITGTRFQENSGYYGGGLTNYGYSATVSDSTFEGNTATYGGGGVYNSGGVTLTGNRFTGNTVAFGAGGGFYNDYYSSATVAGNTFDGNSASNGGGIYVYGYNFSTFSGNVVTNNQGGGIDLFQAYYTIVQDNTITGNIGDGVRVDGGYYNTVGTTDLGNTITGNTGAGVAVVDGAYGNAIRGNVIHANGGLAIDLGGDGRTANDPEDTDFGPNSLQNYPIITGFETGASTRVIGTLNSTPFSDFTIDVYADSAANAAANAGESHRYLGSFAVTTDALGNASFDETLAAATSADEIPTATATDLDNNTSEFSLFVPIQVTPTTGLFTSESGGTATFSVVLTMKPTANVVIPLSSSDTTEGSVSPASLTFTPANWNVPQVVTVKGVDDSIVDGPVSYTIITGAASSSDPLYNGKNPDDVQVLNFGNDFAPLTAIKPAGSLIYNGVLEGYVGAGGGTENYTLLIDPGQKITVVVDPEGTDLKATVQIFQVGNATALGTATAGAAGQDAVLQTVATLGQLGANGPGPKSFQIRVSGAGGTTGLYHLRFILNAAVESESHDGSSNDTRATSQNLEPSFLPLNASVSDIPTGSYPGRGAVLGTTDAGTFDYYSFTLIAGESATLALTGLSWGGMSLALENAAGTTLALGRTGASNLGQVIDNFNATSSGTYYVRVTGDGYNLADYSLVVTRNADFDTEPNHSIATAQDLISNQVSGQRWVLGTVETASSGLFTTGYDGTQLITIDPATGLGQAIGPFGTYQTYTAAFTPDGTLWTIVYGFDSANARLATVNLQTGVATPVGSPNWTGSPVFAMDADAQGNLYAGNWDGTFFRVDKATGQMTPIGFMGFYYAMDFAFDNNGTLWALDDGFNLYTIDPATGAGTYQTAISGLNGSAMGLMVDPSDNSLYLTTYTYDSNLYRLDPATGVATPVGPVGIYYPHGGDFAPPVASKGDFYRITVDANSMLQIETQTPASKSGEFVNNLDPILHLYDSAGNLVASDDNGASDGLNARLSFKVPKGKGGTYYIQVNASPATAKPTHGEYILSVKQATGALPTFQVTSTDLPDGSRLRDAPTTIQVDFNDVLLLTTLQASDLKVDGVPATGVTVVDGDTVVFNLPGGLSEGTHTVAIAAGAIKDVQGTPVTAFTEHFFLDLTPPRVVASSIQQGNVLSPGSLTYVVRFSEPMNTANLDGSDFTLLGQYHGAAFPTSFSYDATGTILTIQYDGLPEDNYTLTLFSGDGQFEDVVGWNLDGEPVTFPIPPNQSGNGVEGGNFFVSFSLDVGTAAFPTPLNPVLPLGSLVYDGNLSGLINFAGDTDSYTIHLDPGQTLTVVASSQAVLYGGVGNGSFNQGSLLLVNPATGAGTFVGDPVTPGGLTGLVYDPSSGVVLGSTIRNSGSGSTLVRIDPATGALLATVGPITYGPGGTAISIGDLAIQPGTNVLYGIGSNASGFGGQLFTIDKSTGVATFVGYTGSGAGGGIAFAPDGSLYQTAFNNGFDFTSLNKIDPTNASRLATVAIPGYFDGLAIRPSDGVIFAATGGPGNAIYIINPVTGAATFVGGTGLGSTSDLAFGPPPLTPTIELRDPNNLLIGTASGSPGIDTVLQTAPVDAGGTYTIILGGASNTSGVFALHLVLNAAVELESHGGSANDTLATAQDINPSFIDLIKGATRGAVLGQTDAGGDLYAFTLDAGQSASVVVKALSAGDVRLELLDSNGNLVASGLPSNLINGSFETGDFNGWTVATTGSPFVGWLVSTAGNGAGFDMAPTQPQNGLYDAWNGFDGSGPMQFTMTQDVTLPVGSTPTLTWQDRIQWNFALTGTATQARIYQVQVLNPATNAVLSTLYSFSTGTAIILGDTGWQSHTADLSAFAGSTVRLRFFEDIPQSFTGPGQIEFDGISLDFGGPPHPTNVDDAISNFVALVAGTYYVRVTGSPSTDYNLVVTRDSVFDLELNNTVGTAQPLGPVHVALGHVGSPGDTADNYTFTAAAGETIHLFTTTPGDGPGAFANTLNPHLRVFDPFGNLVIEGTPTADGRNETIDFTATVAGIYVVEVTAEGGTSGEYVLDPTSLSGTAGLDSTLPTISPLTFASSVINVENASSVVSSDVQRSTALDVTPSFRPLPTSTAQAGAGLVALPLANPMGLSQVASTTRVDGGINGLVTDPSSRSILTTPTRSIPLGPRRILGALPRVQSGSWLEYGNRDGVSPDGQRDFDGFQRTMSHLFEETGLSNSPPSVEVGDPTRGAGAEESVWTLAWDTSLDEASDLIASTDQSPSILTGVTVAAASTLAMAALKTESFRDRRRQVLTRNRRWSPELLLG